jgi:DnaJ-domain-containing protein 1
MLDDKSLWRKFYVKTANKIHPDKVVSKGQEAINEAENQMKLLNAINDKIQKCC